MRLLLAVCLCFTSRTLAFGDENFKRVEDPIDDVQAPGAPISAPVPDPIAGRPFNQPTEAAVDDLGGDAPRFEKGVKADETEWRPRLLVFLHATNNLPEMVKVLVAQRKSQGVTAPISSPPVKEKLDDFTFKSTPIPQPEPAGSSPIPPVELEALKVNPGEFFLLYCDAVTVNVLQEGTTPTYQLECKARVNISTEGFSVDADSASLKDGKCELVNARLNNGVVSATATHLTLTLPIRGVSTTDFGRPIPKSQPTEKAVTPSSDKGNTFNRDIGE
jgi:hypothetical protein